MSFEEKKYPFTYYDSDAASKKAQKTYKITNWIVLGIMFISISIGSLPGEITSHFPEVNKISGSLLLATAIISSLLLILKPEKDWYIGRAVSESVKTLTWRFMMKSEPFNSDGYKEMSKLFIERLGEITTEALKEGFTPEAALIHEELITKKMFEVRSLNYLERKNYYKIFRIEDQIDWYNKKSKSLTLRKLIHINFER